MSDEMKEQTLSAIPWKEMGRPEDIAQAALFLASPKSRYITGQTLLVDGGWTLR
jgi:3-oxoacyl-[acyl-carrier protein] reductase